MLIDENPPLAGVYVEHFGVKGMKWGVRKKRPDEEQRKRIFGPQAKKIAITAAAITGAVAVGYVLQSRGGVSISPGGLTDPNSPLYSTMTSGKQAATISLKQPVKLSDFPSPDVMMAQARMAGVRNEVFRQGNQRLTDATWRASAGVSSAARKMGPEVRLPSLDDVRKKLDDPNYVWDL